MFSGQYLALYRPYLPKSRKDGYVYIHQLQAEKKLGRPLKRQECVHHIDENKFNNDLNNLMVFKTISDHAAFHRGALIHKIDDVWVSDIKTIKISNTRKCICPVCKKEYKDLKAKMCIKCYQKARSVNIPNKDTLLNLILNFPFTKIGKMFNVSDNAVRKWCKKYDLPYTKKGILSYLK